MNGDLSGEDQRGWLPKDWDKRIKSVTSKVDGTVGIFTFELSGPIVEGEIIDESGQIK